MTRVFLAAGVAALAIAAPANAGPHGGGGGGKDRQATSANHGGGGGGGQHAQGKEHGGGGGGYAAPRIQRQSFAQPRMERQQRVASVERAQRSQPREMRAERQQHVQMHAERQQPRHQAQIRTAERQQVRTNRQPAQSRMAERQQVHQNRLQAQNGLAGQQAHGNRTNQAQNRMAERQQFQAGRVNQGQTRMAERQQIRGERQMASSNLLAERHALRADRIANADLFRTSGFARTLDANPSVRFVAPSDAVRFIGEPVGNVTNFVGLSALPASVSYLYPDTSNYYYQYGGGYLYQVDRGSSLINALIPLLAGGYLPGTYLPQPYMSSYVPSSYGLNSFYPASYGAGYGYGYGGYPNLCNRYAYGVVYQVDCYTGMVVNVIPTYAGGYGVGQMLPSAYSSYNVPMQYRSLYYPTADYSYWYAPGAIYQYDTSSSLITSVAALMSPGFSIGQPLPTGYGMYNVPMAYRSTYYDTPNAWYRYNNGNIYQVDPSTMLVTATVASLLS